MATQITINRCNTIQTGINEILGKGATGYGQVLNSAQITIPSGTKRLIYAQDVNNLVADLRRILQHQDGVDYSTNIPSVTVGTTKITEATFANLETYLVQATTNRWKMSSDVSQSITKNGVSSTRTTGWNSEIYHEVVANFNSELNAKYFFNAGGEFIVSTSMTGQSGDKSTAWATMLNSVGTITMNHTTTVAGATVSQIGFYDLTSDYQLLFIKACAAPYTANTYSVYARKDGQLVYLRMLYNDGVAGSPDLTVNGSIISQVKYRTAIGQSVVSPEPSVTSSNELDTAGVSQGYSVSLSPTTVNEGSNIQITITSYPPAASIWYEITGDGPGVTDADFADGVTKESKTLTSGGLQFTKTVVNDVDSDASNVTVKLYDRDPATQGAQLLATSNTVLINDQSISLTLALTSPSPSTPVLNETTNKIANFVVTGTGLPATTSAAWEATGPGATHLLSRNGNFTVTSANGGTFFVTVNPDYKTTGDLQFQVKVSIGSNESNSVGLTITDTSKPTVSYSSPKDPTGATAFTYTDLTYTIANGKPNGTFTFKRGNDAVSGTLTMSGTGTYPAATVTGLNAPGTLTNIITFDTGEVNTHDTVFTADVQELTLSPVLPDITSGKTLQIYFSLSQCYTQTNINWEIVTPNPSGIYKSGTTSTSGTIATTGNTGTGTGSLILEANAADIKNNNSRGASFTVTFSLPTPTTVPSLTTTPIRIIDAFPYTTQLDEQIYLPTLATAITIAARGGAGGGGGRDGGAGGAGGPAFAIVSKEPVLGTNHTVSTKIGKGGGAGGQAVSSLGGGLGGIGYKAGGKGGDVRNTGTSGGGGGGGGATAVLDGTTALVIAGGGAGGGGGSSGTTNSGISGLGMFNTITNMVGVDGTAGAGGGSGDGGGGGGGGAFGGTGGTKGTDGSVRATAGTPGNLASITGTSKVLTTNTGGLGGTATITPTAGVDGEVTIYIQPMAPQYPVAAMQPGGSEFYFVEADPPLKDGSSSITDYTITSSVGTSTGSLPVTSGTFIGTTGQKVTFTMAANNSFGAGVPITVPVQTARLSNQATPGSKCGFSVSISGDGTRMVVGAPRFDNNKGAVFVYTRPAGANAWTYEATLPASNGATGDQFGFSVDIDHIGGRIVVGAPYIGNADQGGVYIFNRTGTTWSQEKFIQGVGTSARNGWAVSIASDSSFILVGIPGYNSPSTGVGIFTAYYLSEAWATARNMPSNATEPNANMGSAVTMSVDGMWCAEGAPGDANQGWYLSSSSGISNAGSVNLYNRSTTTSKSWSAKKFFCSPTPIVDGNFGTSIALNDDGTILVIGAPGETAYGIAKAGTVHVFAGSGTTWDIQAMLTASNPQAGANFGSSVTIVGDTILVGANNASVNGRSGSGIVYKFVKTGTTWTESMMITPYNKAASDSFGASVSMNSTGDLAAIGAPNTDIANTGAAYTFQI